MSHPLGFTGSVAVVRVRCNHPAKGTALTFPGYAGSAGGQLKVTSSSTAVSVTVRYLISNAAEGPGI